MVVFRSLILYLAQYPRSVRNGGTVHRPPSGGLLLPLLLRHFSYSLRPSKKQLCTFTSIRSRSASDHLYLKDFLCHRYYW